MLFSFKYLANALFGAEGLTMREDMIQAKVKEIKQRQDDVEQELRQKKTVIQ